MSEKSLYTQAQKDLTNTINKCKDYYEILGVNKTATDVDLKKAYRKMALQLHPDKNLAPGSTDAFKAVGKAFSVLSDSEKRKEYDLYGPDGLAMYTSRHRRNDENNSEEDLFDPQEIFNMFFGGGFPSENVRAFRRGNTFYYNQAARHQQAEDQDLLALLVRFIPLFVFALVSWSSTYFATPPPYSLVTNDEYSEIRVSPNFKVEYFVKIGFDQQYPEGSSVRKEVEEQVENDYVNHLRNYCFHERMEKEAVRRKGIYFGNPDLMKKAEKMTTPSCDELEILLNRNA